MTKTIGVEQCIKQLYVDATYFHLVNKGVSKDHARNIVLRGLAI